MENISSGRHEVSSELFQMIVKSGIVNIYDRKLSKTGIVVWGTLQNKSNVMFVVNFTS